jgi:transcriptional regulator with XRE-family HTH domain
MGRQVPKPLKEKGKQEGMGMADPEGRALDRELEQVSRRIRHWREEAGLTQQQLATRSGVAASTVHKIEALQMIPSVAVLLKIARGLGRTPRDFISAGSGELELVHLRAEQRHRIGMSRHMLLERLTGDLVDPEVEVWRVEVYPGHGFGPGRVTYDGEQVVVCDEGEVVFHVGDEEVLLRGGDSLHFKATLPHGWENRGTGPARFTVIGTVPQALRSALHERLASGPQSQLRDAER